MDEQQQPVRDEQEAADDAVAKQAEGGTEAVSGAAAAAPKDPELVSFQQGDDVPFEDTTLRGKH